MKKYTLTKEQKKTVTIIGINATENCTCGYADFTEKSYKDSCELLAKELHLQKEELKEKIYWKAYRKGYKEARERAEVSDH